MEPDGLPSKVVGSWLISLQSHSWLLLNGHVDAEGFPRTERKQMSILSSRRATRRMPGNYRLSESACLNLKAMGKVLVESISKHRKDKAIVSSQHWFEKGKSHLSNLTGGWGKSRECCIHLKFSKAFDTSPVTSSQMRWETTGQIHLQWERIKINN